MRFLPILVLLLFSCGSKPEFLYLDVHTVKFTETSCSSFDLNTEKIVENTIKNSDQYFYNPIGNKIYEIVLIKNPPSDCDSLIKAIDNYTEELVKADSKDNTYSSRNVRFYRYSRRTKQFIKTTREYDLLGRIYIDDQREDYLGDVFFKNCEGDSSRKIKTISTYSDETGHTKETVLYECK